MKGLENKQPKVVSACVKALRSSLESFGPRVLTLKQIVKVLPKLLEDRDKTVRRDRDAGGGGLPVDQFCPQTSAC